MKNLLMISCFLLMTISISAQNYLDSLWSVWQDKSQPDTVRLAAIFSFIWDGYLDSDPDSALYFAQLQYGFAKANGSKIYMVRALTCQGLAFLTKADYAKAVKYLSESLKISEENNYKKGIAGSLTNLGLCYSSQGNASKALDFYIRGLKIHEEIGNLGGISICLSSLGTIYIKQGNVEKALEYFQRSLKIDKEIGNKSGIAGSYNDIGRVYQNQRDFANALDYFERGLAIMEEIGDKHGCAVILSNMALTYVNKGDYSNVLDYYQRSLKTYEEMKSTYGIALVSANIGFFYNKIGKHREGLKWCESSLEKAELIENNELQGEACECLYDAHKALGNGNKALLFHEKMQGFLAAVKNEETAKKLQQMEFDQVMLQDSIAKAEEARLVQEAHQADVRKKTQTRNIVAGIGVLILLLAAGLYSRLRFVRKSKASLQVEKDRSENLLLNILPAEIAEELKQKGRADARDFDMVSILFTDFKGFTEASAKLSAVELVHEINHCFEGFDAIMGKYGIEKIKTIGDAYMAAGGLPVPADDSVKNTVMAALEMQHFITQRKAENDTSGKPAFEMRVGIHTGPVVAGIVGVKKFQYDIWGDTVNTASRMESAGEVGKVNISQSTHELLKDLPDFIFESRGKIEAKGKGEVEMWFVSVKN